MPIGQKQANAWGLYDTLGNVGEFVQDWYGEKYYAVSPQSDPPGPLSGQTRVTRGGVWDGGASVLRVSVRFINVEPTRRLITEAIPLRSHSFLTSESSIPGTVHETPPCLVCTTEPLKVRTCQ